MLNISIITNNTDKLQLIVMIGMIIYVVYVIFKKFIKLEADYDDWINNLNIKVMQNYKYFYGLFY